MKEFKKRLIAATPLLCLVAFLIIGFTTDKWHPAWVVFLLIPIVPSILGSKGLSSIFPILIAVIYVVLGLIFKDKWWHPGWIIFFAIPLFYIFFPKKTVVFKKFKKYKFKFEDNDDVIDSDDEDL